MNSMAVGFTRVVPESFERSVAIIRGSLEAAGFTIVEEFDVSKELYFQLGIASRSCLVLLVDTPVLLFEAIALDRTAAAFLPLHVVVTGDRDISYVHWADPIAISGLRPPAPAKRALDEAYTRITAALAEVSQAKALSLTSPPS